MTIDNRLDTFAGLRVIDWDANADSEDSDDGEGFRRFEFQDSKSSKFWAIKLVGNHFVVRFGRIGTNGQEQTKEFPSPEKALHEFNKLIGEKLGKGYEEVESEDNSGSSGFDPVNNIYRIQVTYDEHDDISWDERFHEYMSLPSAEKTVGIVVGEWGNMCEGDDCQAVVDALIQHSSYLPNLRALFIGDVTFEQCEISWINQCNLGPLIAAFPRLEHFGVRGAQELSFRPLSHAKLKSLTVQSGGLPCDTLKDILAGTLPELEHLELWLGSDNYGGDITAADLKPLLDGSLFPKLLTLGLRNSQIADELAKALNGAAILNRIHVLDMSMSTLGDEGAEALFNNPAVRKLKKLDLHYNYLTEPWAAKLSTLPMDIDVTDRKQCEPDDEDCRFCAVSE